MLNILISAAILLAGGPGLAETALIGRSVIHSDGGTVGGLSGLHLFDDGIHFVVISDRGAIVTGEFTRDPSNQITAVDFDQRAPLEHSKIGDDWTSLDAEGLAVAPDGTIYISFEGVHRIGQFEVPDAPEQTLPIPRDFEGLQGNSGLEALAIDSDGSLYAMPERSGRFDRPFPVFRFQNGQWDQPYAIPRTGAYLVVGADFGPDGKLYLLERDFTGFGFYTRVRQLDLEAATSHTILETGIGTHGNMEGISVWKNADDELIMTLVADNNFHSLLTNEIAEYRIDG